MYLNASIPTQICYLDTSFLDNAKPRTTNAWIPIEVFGVTSIPRRCLMFNGMSEFGAQFARIPIHYLSFSQTPSSDFPLDWLQLWDSFSYYFSITRYDYLKNSSAYIILKDKTKELAKYCFTIDWCNGEDYSLGYSEISSGHKCAHVFWGENGQMFAQPNNRILWRDSGAWISSELPEDYKSWKVFGKEFTCEGSAHKWFTNEEESMFYEFKKS